jgi:hypothetical protein
MKKSKYNPFIESAHDQAPYHDWPGQGHDAPLQVVGQADFHRLFNHCPDVPNVPPGSAGR